MRPSRSGGRVEFASEPAPPPPLVPPAAPTIEFASLFGFAGFTITNIDPVAVTRKVYRDAGGGGFFLIATVSATLITYTDAVFVTPGATLLTYKVTDENTAGVSPESNETEGTGDEA